MLHKLLLRAFVWIGARLFSSVIVYAPESTNDQVLAIHFGINETAIRTSCRELVCDEGVVFLGRLLMYAEQGQLFRTLQTEEISITLE